MSSPWETEDTCTESYTAWLGKESSSSHLDREHASDIKFNCSASLASPSFPCPAPAAYAGYIL